MFLDMVNSKNVPKYILDAFYSGAREIVPFCINDTCEVIFGKDTGRGCAVISIEEWGTEPVFLVEFGDDGSARAVKKNYLRLINKD